MLEAYKPHWLANLTSLKGIVIFYSYLSPRPSTPTFHLTRFVGFSNHTSEFSDEERISELLRSSRESVVSLRLEWSGVPTRDISAFTALRKVMFEWFASEQDSHTEGLKLLELF